MYRKKQCNLQWPINSAKSWWNVDFCQYRKDVCPVMSSLQNWFILVFVSTCPCVLFTSQQPNDCDFLWGVCLHASLKAAGLSVNFGNVTTSKRCESADLLFFIMVFWFNILVTRMLQTWCIGSLIPRPPPFLPSVCDHNNTREQKTRFNFCWSSHSVYYCERKQERSKQCRPRTKASVLDGQKKS